MAVKFLDLMLTDSVCRAQKEAYGRAMTMKDAPPRDRLTEDEAAFIATRDSFYMATVNEDGWPYLQHRGGPAGFLRLLDAKTIAFADYRGNHQLISTGHLRANDKVALFLMDYPNRTRLKLLGHARVESPASHPELVQDLPDAEAKMVERVMVIDVIAFDWNCPQHITPRYALEEIDAMAAPLRQRIADLEAEVAGLTSAG